MSLPNYEPMHSIHRDTDHNEAHYQISGQWSEEGMREFLTELSRAVYPFVATKQPWSILADLTDFIAQNRATADAMEESLQAAKDNGIVRLALVNPSPIVLLQHRRVVGDIDMKVFESKQEALAWLRT